MLTRIPPFVEFGGLKNGASPSTRASSAAEEFEAAFLKEMLAQAGVERAFSSGSGFGGEAMANFLLAELAKDIAANGEFGVAALVEDRIGRTL